MSITVTLTLGESSLTLPAPLPGARAETSRPQAAGLSASGQRYVYDAGLESFTRVENFTGLTSAQKEGLATFFHETAVGMQNSFTYTDAAANEYAASFAEPQLSFVRRAAEIWDVGVPLRLAELGA